MPVNGKVAVMFSEAMDPATLTTNTLTLTSPDGVRLAGSVALSADRLTAVFAPAVTLSGLTVYSAQLDRGLRSQRGVQLASSTSWRFTTGAVADTTAPHVLSTGPANGQLGVAQSSVLSATFDESMDPLTINGDTFTVRDGQGILVAGTVRYDVQSRTAFFTAQTPLSRNARYSARVGITARDLAGNPLAVAAGWSFNTVAGPAPVDLGTAGGYVLLAKAAVSTTGQTRVVGDLGLSPAAQSYYTGFSETLDATNVFATSAYVTGRLYAANMASPTPSRLTTAIGDMETAYTDAAGRSTPDYSELGAGDISGLTLQPGLYKWGTGVLATSQVTLAGGPDDTWIFQVAQDLTVANGVHILLKGGARPKNIVWQVAGKVTVGTTADLEGVLLGKTSIELQTGAVLNGRALAQTAVTLDSDAVTQPAN